MHTSKAEDLYIPIMISVGQVLRFVQVSLPHPTFNHEFIVDELLADLFYSYQFELDGLKGPFAIFKRDGIVFKLDYEQVSMILIQANNILLESIGTFLPDFRPVMDGAQYIYHGGESLLIYMPYDKDKYPFVDRSILVPWYAIAHSDSRIKI